MSELFEELFERSPVAMLLVGAGSDIRLVNRHTESLFRYRREELLGQRVEMLVPDAARARHPQLVRDYLQDPQPRQMGTGRELFALRRDGSLFPVEVGLSPVEVGGETLVLGSVIDISDRQKAEHRFRAAFEAAPSGMLMIDSARRIVMVNRQIEETFGYGRTQLVGQRIEVLVPDDFKTPHPRFVESYFRQPEPRAMGIGRELFGRHRTGRLIPVEIGLQPLTAGGETFVISSVVDISLRRATEAEIERKTAEIEQFSYRTSHDLRSPLKSISGMAELVLQDIAAGDVTAATEGTQRIRGLAARLLTLTEDILTLTRVDIADEPVQEFDFASFAALAMDKFDAALTESRVELRFALHHDRPLVVQPTRLGQVLDNLIGNGIKYHSPARDARLVEVRTFCDLDSFFLHVVDNGLGIPTHRHHEVFDMFKRFHNTATPGSGLGLYIVRKQVDRLGADIRFESGSEGTRFYLRLPLQPRGSGPDDEPTMPA